MRPALAVPGKQHDGRSVRIEIPGGSKPKTDHEYAVPLPPVALNGISTWPMLHVPSAAPCDCTTGVQPPQLITVTRKLSLAVWRSLSVTVTVTVALPVRPAAGVSVSVRLAPAPPKTMFASGTSVWLLDERVTTRLPGGVPVSPTVNATWPLFPFTPTVLSAMSVIVGGAGAADAILATNALNAGAPVV